MNRLAESNFDTTIDTAWKKNIDWVEYVTVRKATYILWLCQGYKKCPHCNCREIIRSCWGEISEDDYIRRDTLSDLRKKLEEKFWN